MNKPCDFHDTAIREITAVETKASARMDTQEAFLNMLHDKVSILTKRVEQLETLTKGDV